MIPSGRLHVSEPLSPVKNAMLSDSQAETTKGPVNGLTPLELALANAIVKSRALAVCAEEVLRVLSGPKTEDMAASISIDQSEFLQQLPMSLAQDLARLRSLQLRLEGDQATWQAF
jgi:hypothetical protein